MDINVISAFIFLGISLIFGVAVWIAQYNDTKLTQLIKLLFGFLLAGTAAGFLTTLILLNKIY